MTVWRGDEDADRWISEAHVAETNFTALSPKKKRDHLPGRLVVRRIPEKNTTKLAAGGQDPLFDTSRYQAFFTTVPADKTHRAYAVIEQVNAELKSGRLAHMPSTKFWASLPGWSPRSWPTTSPALPRQSSAANSPAPEP